MIVANEINKSFNNNKVLCDISLTINSGTFFAIKGPSGCGKSTLLNILGLLDTPDSGKLYFDDELINFKNRTRTAYLRIREIGFIFQAYNLMPKLTVYDNILLPFLYLKKSLFNQNLYDTLIERLSLTRLLTKPADVLSGGEKQRVAAARALITNPNIVICDEPTGNLDLANARFLMSLLKEISIESSKTVIMVTHSNDFDSFFDDTFIFEG
ncbi:MAG: ABC transporter ATP-binding protein [Christensenellaceae bacterium]|jgi:putative ABC transport system ATP-binding protein|nr:ABC transporter ATP-binding protein [Christensenellaceae bacterium]